MPQTETAGLPTLTGAEREAVEKRTRELGRDILDRLRHDRPGAFRRQWWDDKIMSWAMHDETLKVQLFRFVDVLPMLHSDEAIARHLTEYLDEAELPAALQAALHLANRYRWGHSALARAARVGARDHARRFIAGGNVREVLQAAEQKRAAGQTFTLDILGEAVITDAEAEHFFQAYLDLLARVSPLVDQWPHDPRLDQDAYGASPRMNLSVKLSALDSRFDAIDLEGTSERVAQRLRTLLRVARRHDAFINVDMESYATKDLILHIVQTVLAEEEFRQVTDVGIVIQCYLHDAERDLRRLRDWAEQRGSPIWVRLVKGAYWDYETITAQARDWPLPVFQEKRESDANFQRLTRYLFSQRSHLRPAFGSHNVRSIAYAMALAEYWRLPKNAFEFQMLYGMGDAEKAALVDMGYRVRVYMPYGELIPGMAYLVRRLLENTSNDSFLRASLVDQRSAADLLSDPEAPADASPRSGAGANEQLETTEVTESKAWYQQFQNHPPVDFAVEAHRREMRAAIEKVREQLGRHDPLWIDGRPVEGAERLRSVNPGRFDQLVGTAPLASVEQADRAIAAAKAALPAWRQTDVKQRCDYLRRAAQAMRDRFFELSAWEVFECGKGWREAAGDVGEAIDFCEYYALGAEAMFGSDHVNVPGERNAFQYHPRGVVGVIAPWNFPLAILTGMSVAALVTGNTVIMKPAEQSPVIAARLMEIFHEIGIPPGVLNFLPGAGEVVGARLVEHPDVALVAFTGSREVGMRINAQAAESSMQASHVKRVIAEMGGKNAIIVDNDADLDEAVQGVVHSAFGYQGQKCSACSRVIVLEDVYETFLGRLIEATRSLKVGQAEEPDAQVGPVIDEEALAKVRRYIELGRGEGTEAIGVSVGKLSEHGFFVGPHIFTDVGPSARLAREEIFGPVLAVLRAKSLDQAIEVANGTDYALTGGIFSRSPEHLKRAERELAVGNLYLNRSITGSLVSRQPFGGFRLSGIGSKAGGPDYLLQFVVPRTVTTNTMRRGFAPS